MPFLKPRRMVKHITDLPASFFKERGLRAVILDVDNTLTTHNNPVPAKGVPEWIRTMQEAGLTLTILSNNYKERVEPFAKQLGLPFVSMAAKPLPEAEDPPEGDRTHRGSDLYGYDLREPGGGVHSAGGAL